MPHLPTRIALITILLFTGCEKKSETIAPLPPIGTKALFIETDTLSAINVSDITSWRSSKPYLCYITEKTPVRSVRNDESKLFLHVVLEENSSKNERYEDLTNHKYLPCNKGAVVQLEATEFKRSVSYLKAVENSQAKQRKVEEEIRAELLKQGQ